MLPGTVTSTAPADRAAPDPDVAPTEDDAAGSAASITKV